MCSSDHEAMVAALYLVSEQRVIDKAGLVAELLQLLLAKAALCPREDLDRKGVV